MAKRRRSRRRRYRYSGWYSSTPSKREQISSLYGGIDGDVRSLFFKLDPFTLKLVFNRYAKEYGEGKRKYAESTFKKWKSGKVQMGGEISERLVTIVPPFLDFDQKYHLITKLWNKHRSAPSISVTITPQTGIDAATSIVLDAIEDAGEIEIPSQVADRLAWLASDDAVTAQALLQQVERREAEIIASTLDRELTQLLAVARAHSDKNVSGHKVIKLPSISVTIYVSQHSNVYTTGGNMSSDESESSRDLARRDESQKRSDLAPIDNPNDLMGEALKRMSPKKQEEVIGKATDEALRLQVKQQEGALDQEMAARKVDEASSAADHLSRSGVDFEVHSEHRSEHGSTNITVRSPKRPLSKALGGCFIATAAYGDYSHPMVLHLRFFRDEYLTVTSAGRTFIRCYYRLSPSLARLIAGHLMLRGVVRVGLWPAVQLVKLLRFFNT